MLSTLAEQSVSPWGCEFQEQQRPEDLEALKQLLSREDRMLLELRSTEGVTLRTIASFLGCTRGTASRRLAALTRRLEHPRAILIANRGRELSALYRHIAIAKHIRGQCNVEIAESLGISPLQVREALQDIADWCAMHLGG